MKSLAKRFTKNDNLSYYILMVVFLLLFAFFSFSTDSFFKMNNFMNILRQSSVSGILAVAMTFVIISGGIDLSVGSVLGLSGVILASYAKSGSANWWSGILLALLCGVVIGLINGLLISKCRIIPFIQTLAMMTIARGLTMLYADGKPISDLHDGLTLLGKTDLLIPASAWIFIITILLAWWVLKYTVFGKNIYAVGGNEKAARISGINTERVKTLVYTISGLLCGVAAIVLTSRVASALPRAGEGYEMDAIAAVVIGGASLTGGRGSVVGTVIGTLLMGVLSTGMDLMSVGSYSQSIIKGIIIIFAVLLDSIKNRE